MSASESFTEAWLCHTIVHSGVRGTPLDVPAWDYAVIEEVVRKDRSMLGVPWSAECAFLCDIEGVVRLRNMAGVDVCAILVLESCVATLPGGYASTASTELNVRLCYPKSAKPVELVRSVWTTIKWGIRASLTKSVCPPMIQSYIYALPSLPT